MWRADESHAVRSMSRSEAVGRARSYVNDPTVAQDTADIMRGLLEEIADLRKRNRKLRKGLGRANIKIHNLIHGKRLRTVSGGLPSLGKKR